MAKAHLETLRFLVGYTQKSPFSSLLSHQFSSIPAFQRINNNKKPTHWWSIRQIIVWTDSGSRSNRSIKGEEWEGDSWPWSNYWNMQASSESHRCPRPDDWSPELHMCALCQCAFCFFWVLQCWPWSKAGISRVEDGKKSRKSSPTAVELSCIRCWVLRRLMSSISKKFCTILCVLNHKRSCSNHYWRSLIAWNDWEEG